MPVGLQEWIALLFVAVVVALALFRRRRRKKTSSQASCEDCTSSEPKEPGEQSIRFYRKQK